MYAIVDISGKQFRVEPKSTLKVPFQKFEAGNEVSYDKVLLVDDGKNVKIGTPYVSGSLIKATIIEHGRDKKIVVFKKKRRKGYKVKNTHRQEFTRIHVDTINLDVAKQNKSSQKEKTTEKED
ncbi:MAG: 50S ribosomal protein L21 [Candidatus Marinimicrobia bacterium]|nr:50S ribosomal protein L21 [Candidatus Neomarinimicrobiota bacterium]